MLGEHVGQAPWVVFASIILTWFGTWFTQEWRFRNKRAGDKSTAQIEHDTTLEIHRDQLTFELLENARQEMGSARLEMDDLREEIRKLRSMENHFYHFQQSLDHIEALLVAKTPEERAVAERNATAFLNRMRRLNDAKGTINNEAQHVASKIRLMGDDPVLNRKGKSNADG